LPEIIGLMPMGGNGTRLGMPFPKPLAPTITGSGIVPLYHHTLGELRKVTGKIFAIVNETTDGCLLRSIDAEGVDLVWSEEPTLPGALGDAGKVLAAEFGKDTLVATILPDAIWRCNRDRSLADVVAAVKEDGALALFMAASDELDEVFYRDDRVIKVVTKRANGGLGMVQGWGAFVIRAGALATFTDAEKDGPQLGKLKMGWVFLGNYVDLGTPERYIRWHDTRWREHAGEG
jgi:hypothetical protein